MTGPTNPKEILVQARALLVSPNNWNQGVYCSQKTHAPCFCYCLDGAIRSVASGDTWGDNAYQNPAYLQAVELVYKQLPTCYQRPAPDYPDDRWYMRESIHCFNDASARTYGEVVDVLEKAIAAAP